MSRSCRISLLLILCNFMYVVLFFLSQSIFIFPLFWGMVTYANKFETKEKQQLTDRDKKKLTATCTQLV